MKGRDPAAAGDARAVPRTKTADASYRIVDRAERVETGRCGGPDELGHCPQVGWGDVVPCAGHELVPKGNGIRVSVPDGSSSCPVLRLQPPKRSVWWLAAMVGVAALVAGAGSAIPLTLALAGGGSTRPATASSGTGVGAGPAAIDAVINPAAKPAADWKPFDPTLSPAPGGTVHDVTLHVRDVVMQVAPGVTQTMWTFNGQVPGPILRGHVGDVFNVTLVNDGSMPHSIDFHASQTSMTVDMRSIAPGQSLVYQFQARYAGIFMYHCGTVPALQHIGSGMYGAVIIDPPGLDTVSHEYVMVQSELYLGPLGKAADFSKMTADKPDAVVFNGYYNQYKYAPIDVKTGDRIRVWVIDDGPSDISSFHVVGTIFDTVYKEGAYLLRKGDPGGSQALDLMPAQGGFVELNFAKPGMYAMVSHKFADANNGALGVFMAS